MFDEPLGALDRNLREQLMAELRRILRLGGLPAIYVTHDQDEAFYLADRVLLLHEGTIVRDGTPADIWADPGSAWAARFLDAGNILSGVILSSGRVKTLLGILPLECRHDHLAGDEITIMISKRGARLGPLGGINGKVTDVVFSQDGYKITLENGPEFYLPKAPQLGQSIYLEIPTNGIKCLS
jgi:ABC-type Fe3+/spermidine/putrescine transport system ATPase subunit